MAAPLPARLPARLAAINLDLRYEAENGALMAGPANPLIFAAHPQEVKTFFFRSPPSSLLFPSQLSGSLASEGY
jgi:hypothetical protein